MEDRGHTDAINRETLWTREGPCQSGPLPKALRHIHPPARLLLDVALLCSASFKLG